MYAGDLTVTDQALRIDIRGNLREPGLFARKVWEVLFRNTRISKANNFDSFLCDLKSFEQLLSKGEPFWWYFRGPWTEITTYDPGGAFRIEVIENEIVITKPA